MTVAAVSNEVRVRVADLAVGSDTQILITIGLGSCVAIALHDPVARVGGLAHILLPAETMARDRSNPAKFPASAIAVLLSEMTRLGADPRRVRAKLVGGASMFANLLPNGNSNIGERNVIASREALAARTVPIVAEDTGRDYGRSVYFHVADGRLEVRSLKMGDRVI